MSSSEIKKQPLVTAIIVNYNTKTFLVECLNTLLKPTTDEDIEIIVVDNNSSDGSVEEIKQNFPTVKLIANKNNLMFAGGVNQGIEHSNGKYFLILNPDIIITKEAVFELTAYLERNPSVVGVSPQLYYPNGKIQTEFFPRLPSLPQLIFFYTFFSQLSKKYVCLLSRYYEVPVEPGSETIVEQLPGACMLVSSNTVAKIGGMDENFTLFYEDVDWCKRISQFGHQIAYAKVTAIHHGGSSHEKHEPWIYGRFRVSMLLYFKKHAGKFRFFTAKFVIFCVMYIGIFIRLIQKLLPFYPQDINEYHLKKYKFFLDEYRQRKSSFEMY